MSKLTRKSSEFHEEIHRLERTHAVDEEIVNIQPQELLDNDHYLRDAIGDLEQDLIDHETDVNNPHNVTAAQVGAIAAINGITAPGGYLSIWQQGEDLEIVNDPETGTILLVNNHNGRKDNPHEVTHDQVDPAPVEYDTDETRDKHLSNYDFSVLVDHLHSSVAHGSTPENMEGRIIQRDAEGRAKVSDPEDDDDIATKGYVDQSLSSFGGVPRGIITMWSGSAANIPAGWALCDGSNGTPDLRDRFIVGAGGSYNVGDTGGANTVTLTVDQMPSHSHSSGTLDTYSSGSHSHTYMRPAGEGTYESGNYNTYHAVGDADTSTDGSHSHDITGDTGNTGGGQAHENRPPYYALAYIMKL